MRKREIKPSSNDRKDLLSLEAVTQRLLTKPLVREGYNERKGVIGIARAIKEVRSSLGLTQQDLANLMATSQPEIARLEAGLGQRGPTADMLRRFASACRSSAFFGFTTSGVEGHVSLNESVHMVTEVAKRAARTTDEFQAIEAVEAIQWIESI